MQQTGDCDAGVRGTDCAFNSARYFAITAVIWVLTALPLLAWATPCLRRQWSASKAARISLLFTATSALCCCADGVLASTTKAYGMQTLWTVGSILLVFGICAFSTTWCDVASALSGLHARDQGWGNLITRARQIYKWMAMLHVPFALVFSVHDYQGLLMPEGTFNTLVIVWGVWLVFGTLFVLTGLACVQCYIARVGLASVDRARSLQETALINLIQQLFLDLLMVVYGALYMTENKTEGSIIAAYHALGFIAFWTMHVQVVVFFAILGNTDPMYNEIEFSQLIFEGRRPKDDIPASTVGSPGNKIDNVA